jgi:outer membrane protein
MKKMLSALFASALLSCAASADIVRVEAGGGAWMQKPSGSVSYTTSTESGSDTSTEKEKTLGYAWLYIKHPVPVLPNLRLEYSSVQSKGDVEIVEPIGAPVTTSEFDAQAYDAILYYNLLDNTFWTTVDLGLDVKMLDYEYDVAPTVATPDGYSKSGTLFVPMGYLRGRLEVPATGIGFEGVGSFITYNDVTFVDARIKVDYTLDFVPVVQPGIEVGYRIQKVKYDQDDSAIAADVDFSGVYVGAMLRF